MLKTVHTGEKCEDDRQDEKRMKNEKKFTYAILAYKQRTYLIDQLFSIRYQILKFGTEWENHLLVIDDASKDGTIEAAEAWIEEYPLFQTVNITENEENLGTVKTYLKALHMLKTRKFKILAADDLYYKNNIYHALRKDCLVISPVIRFDGMQILNETFWGNYRMLLGQKRLKALLQDEFRECWIIETPGTFWDLAYLQDDIDSYLDGFKYVEDVRLFHYLIVRTAIKVKYDALPYVLYRMGGVSTTTEKSSRVSDYNAEAQKLENEMFDRKKRLSRGINIYRYYHGLKWRYYRYLAPRVRKEAKRFEAYRQKELVRAGRFLEMIRKESSSWERTHGK